MRTETIRYDFKFLRILLILLTFFLKSKDDLQGKSMDVDIMALLAWRIRLLFQSQFFSGAGGGR